MSTPGGAPRRPSAVKPGGKPTSGDPASATPDEPAPPPEPTDKVAAGRGATTRARTGKGTSGAGKAGAGKAGAKAAGAKAGAAKGAGNGTAGGAKAGATAGGPGAAKAAGARPGGRAPGARPAGAAKDSGRRPAPPVKVSQSRNWGSIAMLLAVLLLSGGIIGYAAWQVREHGRTWQDRAADISGLHNYVKTNPKLKTPGQHEWGPLKFDQSPPVGGTHNPNWQNCMGDVYDAAVANEHAVHSMEHGAVWITYNPDKVSASDVTKLAAKVRGKEYLLMSPYPGLDKAVSVQAWGYQLKVDSVGDKRIDKFIGALRKNAGIEQGAVCSGGITETGTTPRDLGKDQPGQATQPGLPAQPGG